MATFYDDFERANGALGGNWLTVSGSTTISGGFATTGTAGTAVNTTIDTSGRLQAGAHFGYVNNAGAASCVGVKCNNSTATGYWARVAFSSPDYYFQLGKGTPWTFTLLSQVSLGTTTPFWWLIELVYDSGTITATYNGGNTLTANDLEFSGGTLAGFYAAGTGARIGDFTAIGGSVPLFDVTEALVGNYGACTELHLTGTNTAWTPGTPGSPTFTVDHGSISAQEVLTATTATLTYCPGDFLGTATFTDPSTGATDTVLVSSDPNVIPPTGTGDTWAPYKALVDNTGIGHLATRIVTEDSAVPTAPDPFNGRSLLEFLVGWQQAQHGPGTPLPSETGLLNDLLRYLIDGQEITPGENVFSFAKSAAADANALHVSMDAMRGVTEITLQQILDAIAGVGGGDWVKLFTQIGVDGQAVYASIIDALSQIRGDQVTDLALIASRVQAIRTGANLSLRDVLDEFRWLRTDNGYTLGSILDVLSVYNANYIQWFAAISAQVQDVDNYAQLLWSSDEELRGPSHLTLEDILTRLDYQAGEIIAAIDGLRAPPIWPGLERVTLGTPRDLATTHDLAEPMHGVIINITGTDPGTGFYDYDTHRCWRNVGSLSFYNDVGAQEPFQVLGWTKGIYTPTKLVQAAGVRTHLGRGPRGTITPWTIN